MKSFENIKYKTIISQLVFCFFILILFTPLAYAQSIPITLSDRMDQVIFDGKWSFTLEWKWSSLDKIQDESNMDLVYIRTAHQDDFIYVMLNVESDKTIDYNQDEAVLCFEAKNESINPENNYYCFVIKLGSDKPVTLQGSSTLEGFKVVENHSDLIAVAAASDENDRYSKIPHTTYEFRIPIELVKRTDQYGFLVKVFDFTNSKTYTWPSEINLESHSEIPSPEKWGIIYSPDKSLPEYELPILVLILGTLGIILVSLKNKKQNLFYLFR